MSRRRRAREVRHPEPAFEVLLRALSKQGYRTEAQKLLVLSAWPKVVGERIASRTQAHAFRDGCLWVQAATPTWQNELTFLRGQILRKLNALLKGPTVRMLRITSGALPTRGPAEQPSDAHAPTPREVEKASRCAEAIADAATRRAFTRLMAVHLRHRQVGRAKRPGPE